MAIAAHGRCYIRFLEILAAWGKPARSRTATTAGRPFQGQVTDCGRMGSFLRQTLPKSWTPTHFRVKSESAKECNNSPAHQSSRCKSFRRALGGQEQECFKPRPDTAQDGRPISNRCISTTTRQISLAFGQDPLHLDNNVTQYVTWPSMILGILSSIWNCLLPSVLLPYKLTYPWATSSANFHKLSHHPCISWPQPGTWSLSLQREDVEWGGKRDNRKPREDKVPLRDNRSATHGELYLRRSFGYFWCILPSGPLCLYLKGYTHITGRNTQGHNSRKHHHIFWTFIHGLHSGSLSF